MIAPQELRLGNFVQTFEGIFTVSALNQQYIALCNETIVTYPALSPIELNEDWLLKLGFECNKNEYCVPGLDRFNVFLTVKSSYLFCDDEKAIRYVRYVHELQNVFYAIVSEELKIKES